MSDMNAKVRRALRTFWFAVWVVAIAGCSINPIPTPGNDSPAGADAIGEPTRPTDAGAAGVDVFGPLPAEDAGAVDSGGGEEDTAGGLSVTVSEPEATCVPTADPDDVAGRLLSVELRWSTSRPCLCSLARVVRTGDPEPVDFQEEEPSRDHAATVALGADDFWVRFPMAGSENEWVVDCESDGESGSASSTYVLDQDGVDCIWPFLERCGDGSDCICRAGPPDCSEGLVAIVVERMGRCVYPATCTCDDGSALVCASPRPTCEDYQEVAVQDGCHVCVSPFTCERRE